MILTDGKSLHFTLSCFEKPGLENPHEFATPGLEKPALTGPVGDYNTKGKKRSLVPPVWMIR